MNQTIRKLSISLSALFLLLTAAVPAEVKAQETQYGDINGDPVVSEVELILTETDGTASEQTLSMSGDLNLVKVIVEMEEPSVLEQFNQVQDVQARAYEESLKKGQNIILDRTADLMLEKASSMKKIGAEQSAQAISESAQKMRADIRFTRVMNGFVTTVPKAMMSEIESMDGVKRVFEPVAFELPEPVETGSETEMSYSSGMIGAGLVNESGYDGRGLLIGVMDTGLDLYHNAFANDPAEPKVTEETQFSLSFAEDTYKSAKVPFGYDYGNMDPDIIPTGITSDSSHGTHVSGIAAGKDKDFAGVAPEAQLAFFKIFADDSRWTYDYQIVMALEDAVAVHPDVLNLSIGEPSGGDGSDSMQNWGEEAIAIGEAFQRVYDSGIPISISGGNEYFFGLGADAEHSPVHVGITSSPGTYHAPVSVASIENIGRTQLMFYSYNSSVSYYDPSDNPETRFSSLSTQSELEYVDCNLGLPEDFANVEIEGKVALVRNSDVSVMEKQANAAEAGAIALIVYNDTKGSVRNMITDTSSIPCISIAMERGLGLLNEEKKVIYHISDQKYDNYSKVPYTSSFSSWGTTDDLRMKPEIAAPGGNIYSSVIGGYESFSGTSMAAPHLAASIALVRQYAKENELAETDQDLDRVAIQLLMSTAKPVLASSDTEIESVRHVGAGLINIVDAMNAKAYLSVNNTDDQRPKLELGDDPLKTGVYPFSFNITNISDVPLTYTISADAKYTVRNYAFTLTPMPLDINFDCASSITVEAGSSAEISGTVSLPEQSRQLFENTPAGMGFVDGYIYLDPDTSNGDSVQLSIPYMAFYGDWNSLPVLDVTLEHGAEKANGMNGLVSFDSYQRMLENAVEYSYYCHMIGMNPEESINPSSASRPGSYYFSNYDRKYMVTSSLVHPDLIGYNDPAVQLQDKSKHIGVYSVALSVMKNINQYRITASDAADGTVYYDSGNVDGTLRKVTSQTGSDTYARCLALWPATDQNQQPLAEGTEVNVDVTVSTDGGAHTESMILPLTIDNTAPVIVGGEDNPESETGTFTKAVLATTASGKKYLKFDAQDNYYLAAAKVGSSVTTTVDKPFADLGDPAIADVEFKDQKLEGITDETLFTGDEKNELNHVILDVTDLDLSSIYVGVYDYADLKKFYKVSADSEKDLQLRISPAETTLTIDSDTVDIQYRVTDQDGAEISRDSLSGEIVDYEGYYSHLYGFQLSISPNETVEQLKIRVSMKDDPDVFADAVVHLEYAPSIELAGKSLALDGKIGLNFYTVIPEEILKDADASLMKQWNEVTDQITMKAADAPESTVTVDGVSKKARVFTMRTAAKEMRDNISLTFTRPGQYSSSYIMTYMNGGRKVRTSLYTFSVEDYFNLAESSGSEKLKPLTRSLNNYGKYAQYYFNYNTSNIWTGPDDVSEVTEADLEPYKEKIEGSVNGLKYAGSTLELEADTLLRLYFQPESGHKIDEYTFTVDGKTVKPVQRSSGSSYYYVTLENIAGKELGLARTFQVSRGNETMAIACSALSYAYKALTSETSGDNLRNTMRALYLYNQAAIDYFAE